LILISNSFGRKQGLYYSETMIFCVVGFGKSDFWLEAFKRGSSECEICFCFRFGDLLWSCRFTCVLMVWFVLSFYRLSRFAGLYGNLKLLLPLTKCQNWFSKTAFDFSIIALDSFWHYSSSFQLTLKRTYLFSIGMSNELFQLDLFGVFGS
jgi:hypothetical protein